MKRLHGLAAAIVTATVLMGVAGVARLATSPLPPTLPATGTPSRPASPLTPVELVVPYRFGAPPAASSPLRAPIPREGVGLDQVSPGVSGGSPSAGQPPGRAARQGQAGAGLQPGERAEPLTLPGVPRSLTDWGGVSPGLLGLQGGNLKLQF